MVRISLALLAFLSSSSTLNVAKNRWGNRVYKETLDWYMTPLRKLSPGTTFGCAIYRINPFSIPRLRQRWFLGQQNGR